MEKAGPGCKVSRLLSARCLARMAHRSKKRLVTPS